MLKHLVLAEWAWTAGDGQLETPKGHHLAVDRHFSLSSTSILEALHCLSPPGGLDAEQLLVCLCVNGEENSVKIISLNHFPASVVSCAYRTKETSPACSPQYSPPCCTTDLYQLQGQKYHCTHSEKLEVPFTLLGPKFWNIYWIFTEGCCFSIYRKTARTNICPLCRLKKKDLKKNPPLPYMLP